MTELKMQSLTYLKKRFFHFIETSHSDASANAYIAT
ncbi:hypothetical protein ACUXQE_001367 [Staphylococcus saprophyticus]